MEERNVSMTPKALPAPVKRQAAMDGKDRLLLLAAWALGIFFVQLMIQLLDGLPALGMALFVAACYGVLFWYAGRQRAFRKGNRLLSVGQVLLTLCLALFSNYPFRLLNYLALCLLASVELFQRSGLAKRSWQRASVLWESLGLSLAGLFLGLDLPFRAAVSCRKGSSRRAMALLLAAVVLVPLLAVVLPLLLSADPVFDAMLSGFSRWVSRHLSGVLGRVCWGAAVGLFLYSLLYFLRHGGRGTETALTKADSRPFRVDALAPGAVLVILDGVYAFFLGVQSSVLFGGRSYLDQVGMSYAQYARSGFFQLVWVVAINLAVLLAALRLCAPGKGRRAVQVLSTLLVAESGVLLLSAVWRMSLYVAAYGLSRLRVMVYWGIALLAVFLVAALLKIWKQRFGFFKVFFAACLLGWLILNFVCVDGIIARYNVSRYLDGSLPQVDVHYLTTLSYEALPALERLPGTLVADYESAEDPESGTWDLREVSLDEVLQRRRARAAWESGSWTHWNLSAAITARF